MIYKIDNNFFFNECKKFLDLTTEKIFLREDKNPLYDDLLIGFQKADHPVFAQIAQIIPEHLIPYDFLPESMLEKNSKRVGLSVVSFSFCLNKKTVDENASAEFYPSHSWYVSTNRFNEFTSVFKRFIGNFFDQNKIRYVFPNSIKEKYRIIRKNGIKYSTWSERHIAYACGLGSFGLHGSLITDKGCAHRLMSVIIDNSFYNYNEPDQPWNKNCLSANNIKCGTCIKKCPVNSIQTTGRSIINCLKHESDENKEASKRLYGYEMEACGLCMSGVPCSTVNPMLKLRNYTDRYDLNNIADKS